LDQSKRSPQGVILFGGDTRAKVETDFYTAARLRIGLAANTVLLYGTGGWIGVDTETSVVDPCNTPPCGPLRLNAKSSEFRSGWTAGGGIEIGFTPSISCKLEYMFVDLGTEKVNDLGVATNFTFPGAWDISTRAHMFRFGLNYRF
jgi:outer membrane immunogenic protein